MDPLSFWCSRGGGGVDLLITRCIIFVRLIVLLLLNYQVDTAPYCVKGRGLWEAGRQFEFSNLTSGFKPPKGHLVST